MLRSAGPSLPASTTSPAFLSPIHRRLAVSVSEQGVLLRPAAVQQLTQQLEEYDGPAVQIQWGTSTPEAIPFEQDADLVFTVPGVAGILKGPGGNSYLILISDSTVAATLPDARKSSINAVTALLSIPLGSFENARLAIARYSVQQSATKGEDIVSPNRSAPETDDEATEDDHEGNESVDDGATTDGGETTGTETEADARPPFQTAVKKPFWKKPPSLLRKLSGKPSAPSPSSVKDSGSHAPVVSIDESATVQPKSADPMRAAGSELPKLAAAGTSQSTDQDSLRASIELDQKVLAETLRTLRGMHFCVDVDITRSLQRKHMMLNGDGSQSLVGLVEPSPTLPLWRRADRRFFWNAHLMEPFISAALHSYVVVLQQGFVGAVNVSLPIKPFSNDAPSSLDLGLMLISRRSVDRPGLRYQRRGINSDGHVANAVETEFIVTAEREDTLHVGSFVQTRGSIPVFWSQSPWALKPAPVLERTPEQSLVAMRKHFEDNFKRYGKTVVVNLAETTGKEAVVVNAYSQGVEQLDQPQKIKYVEFDFHGECRGMRFENVSKLITRIGSDLDDMGNLWLTDKQGALATQDGVVRTNCIDCLDRTNVVQSAIARYFLGRHLVHLGVTSHEEAGMHDGLDYAFNGLWADNGDAISREYAGTSALKGDFTRTGKRNWRGAVNDATNSVARLMQGAVSDFFRQAVLDYVLGVNSNAFAEYSEHLQSSDPTKLVELRKIRQEAVETSVQEVLSEGEDKIAGWTLLSPAEADAARSPKNSYLEKVLLVSNRALYVVEYEFTLQKVIGFTRIPMADIFAIQTGPFILSSLEAATRDPVENYGFAVKYKDHSVTQREHTYTMRPSKEQDKADPDSDDGTPRFFAFKALRRDAVRTSDGQSRIVEPRQSHADESKTARDLVVNQIVPTLVEEGKKRGVNYEVEEKDIISLADARSHTSVFARLERSLQRAIWL
ncbi:hypothetical protein OIO90_000112 [Microbotryomycetes sp. JL221]|nr:hypothetical protein OIO90_000112 [Microbotryomycetes sp. JL221]